MEKRNNTLDTNENYKNGEEPVADLSDKKLPYDEELKIVAERFNMTESQTLEFVVHEVYKSQCFSLGLIKALELLKNYDEMDDIIPEDITPIDKALSSLYQAIGTLESIGRNPPF